MGPRVLVLHQPFGAAGVRDIRRAAEGLCEPVLLMSRAAAEAYPDLVRAAERLLDVTVAGDGELSEAARRLRPDGVTTFHDALLETAARLTGELGLPGMADASVWDKAEQRRLLAEAGLTRVRALPVDGPRQLSEAVEELGLPCVLKPRRGVGGAGVAFLESPADVRRQLLGRRHWAGLLAETRLPDGRHPAAAEGRADFVSVESVSCGGVRWHPAVFDKRSVTVVPAAGADGADLVTVNGDLVPSRLDAAAVAEVEAYTSRVLAALDVSWRVTHTEIKLTPQGPDVIEVNGRVGGHLNRLLHLVGGPDLVRTALSLALGRRVEPAPWHPAGHAAGLFPSFPHRQGTVRSAVTLSDLRALPGVRGVEEVAEHGHPVAETGGRMANLTLFAATAQELADAVDGTRRGLDRLFALDLA